MIELNGVANLKMLLDTALAEVESEDPVLVPMAKMYQQLDLLERYMVAVAKTQKEMTETLRALSKSVPGVAFNPPKVPYWHEVYQNKDKFPLNGGRK